MRNSKVQISPLRLLPAVMAVLLLLPLLQGCGGRSHIHRDLLHAENIMEENPDSAYNILSALQPDSGDSEEDRALHALLLTQAMYKTDRFATAPKEVIDSQGKNIDSAIGYFEKVNDRKRMMESYFFRGIAILSKDDSLPYALEPFSISLDLAMERKDSFYIAKNYSMMSDIYAQKKAYHDQVEAERHALDYFKTTGKKDFINYSRYSLAGALFASGRHEEALLRLDTLLADLPQNELTPLKVRALNTKARALFYCKNYGEVVSLIEYLDKKDRHQPDLTLFHAASYIELKDIPRAKKIMATQAEDLDSIDKNILDNILYNQNKNISPELQAIQTLYDGLTQDYKEITQGNLNTIQTLINHNASHRHYLEKENMRLRQVLVICISIIIIALMFLIIFRIYKRKRSAEKKLDEQGKELQNTYTELENVSTELESTSAELENTSAELKNTSAELENKSAELKNVSTELENASAELKNKSDELEKTYTELEMLVSDIQKKDSELKTLAEMKNKIELDINEIIDQYGGQPIQCDNPLSNTKEILSELIEDVMTLNKKEIQTIKENTRATCLGYIRMVSQIISEICEKDSFVSDKNRKISENIDSLKKYIGSFKPKSPEWQLRESMLDILTDNAIKNLRTGENGMPKLREDYIIMATYLLYGFDYETISMLFGKDKRSLYNLKKRLNDKFNNITPVQREIYKDILERTNSGT